MDDDDVKHLTADEHRRVMKMLDKFEHSVRVRLMFARWSKWLIAVLGAAVGVRTLIGDYWLVLFK